MKNAVNAVVTLVGGIALLFAAGCMNVAKKMQEAETAYKAGQYPKVCEITAKVLKKDKQNVSAMLLNGLSLHQQERNNEAGTMLAQAASLGAADFAAQYFYGLYLVNTGDFKTAMTPLRQAYKINAAAAKAQPEALLVLLSRCCMEENLSEGTQYLQMLRRFPGMRDNPSLYNNLGILWNNQGKYLLAQKSFEEAWVKDPQNIIAPQNLAVIYDIQKNTKQALRHYKFCYAQVSKAGDTVGAERYQSRIAALERENPKTPAAVKPAGKTVKKPVTGKTGATTKSTKPGTASKTGSKAKSSTTKSSTGKAPAKKTASHAAPKHG